MAYQREPGSTQDKDLAAQAMEDAGRSTAVAKFVLGATLVVVVSYALVVAFGP